MSSRTIEVSLTVCIGAMAILGTMQDGLRGDYTVWERKIRVANMLPAVILAIIWSYFN
ncbi:TPA: DUF554 family protein [Streptococcus suis]|nr:DUF554 family protein [Streptococcus suis]